MPSDTPQEFFVTTNFRNTSRSRNNGGLSNTHTLIIAVLIPVAVVMLILAIIGLSLIHMRIKNIAKQSNSTKCK